MSFCDLVDCIPFLCIMLRSRRNVTLAMTKPWCLPHYRCRHTLKLLQYHVVLFCRGTPLSEMPSYAAESLVRFPHLLIMDYKRRPDKPAPHPLLLALKAGPTVDA